MGANNVQFHIRFKETEPTGTWEQESNMIFDIVKKKTFLADRTMIANGTVLQVDCDEVSGYTEDIIWNILGEVKNNFPGIIYEAHRVEFWDTWSDQILVFDGEETKEVWVNEKDEGGYEEDEDRECIPNWFGFEPQYIFIMEDGYTDDCLLNYLLDEMTSDNDEEFDEEDW